MITKAAMLTTALINCSEPNITLARSEKLGIEKEIVIPGMELPLLSIILLAAETSGDSHHENQQSLIIHYKSICDALQAAFLP